MVPVVLVKMFQTPTPTAGAGGIGIRVTLSPIILMVPGPGSTTGYCRWWRWTRNSSATGGAWDGSSLQPGGPFAGAGQGGPTALEMDLLQQVLEVEVEDLSPR